MAVRALIFDVDGTLAETEEAHRTAFNRAFEECGLDWRWSVGEYRQLLLVTGGKERIKAFAADKGYGKPLDVVDLHRRKTSIYKDLIEDGLVNLRPGVACLVNSARNAGLKLAIATTTSRPNVETLLERMLGADAGGWFDVMCCGDDVARKKPDPAIYLLALEKLCLGGEDCVAFEDSLPGLQSATAAGIGHVVVTPSLYTNDQDFSSARYVMRNLASYHSHLEMQSQARPDELPDPLPALLFNCLNQS